MGLVDAHIHLPTYADRTETLGMAQALGITLLSCTVSPSEASLNLQLRDENPHTIRCFLGVGPSEASEDAPSSLIGDLVKRADGIGEIGLDTKYSETSRESPQMRTFVDQLETAEKLGKPVQVHSRGSERACLDVLSSFRPRSVLMHWFEGEEEVKEVVSRGYYASFGPAILYSKKLRRVASALPAERLLTETDGPVSFAPLGGRSGPGLIASVLFCMAEVKNASFDEMRRAVQENLSGFLDS